MGAFEYTALDSAGREQNGVVEGDTVKHVRQILRERLSELRERRAGRLEQEAIDAPVPAEPRAQAPAEDSVPPREGSDAVAR